VSVNEAHSDLCEMTPDSTGVFRLRRPRIAVIDDDQCIVSVVRRTLASEYDVYSHTDGNSAVQWLVGLEAESAPDLVLCDMSLGPANGVDVYDGASAVTPRLRERIAFITGGACSERDGAFLAEHAEMIVHKPFTPHSLRAWVRSTLQRLGR
jgi:DNA-binding response OmpR family regulator